MHCFHFCVVSVTIVITSWREEPADCLAFSLFRDVYNVHVCHYGCTKKISNDQELIQSDPISCPQNQKGNNKIHKLTTVYERHSRQTE